MTGKQFNQEEKCSRANPGLAVNGSCQAKGFQVKVLLAFVISITGSLIVMLKVILNKKAPSTSNKELE